jgi:hypothetical protein
VVSFVLKNIKRQNLLDLWDIRGRTKGVKGIDKSIRSEENKQIRNIDYWRILSFDNPALIENRGESKNEEWNGGVEVANYVTKT